MTTATRPITIERADGTTSKAHYVKHLRTLTGPNSAHRSKDLDLYRLADGREIVCVCDPGDCRVSPMETDLTAERSQFVEWCDVKW